MKILLSGFIFILPELAFAHAGQRGHVMLLPTNLYIVGGAAVVALTFIFMIISPSSRSKSSIILFL